MSPKEKKIGTTLIIGLLLIMFIVDIILRYMTGNVTFTDLLLGNNAYGGTYESLWFKTSLFLDGQFWRCLSWMFWSKGILHFIIEISVLYLLCATLEKWLGTFKFLITYVLLGLTFLFSMFLVYAALYNNMQIDYGMGANTLSVIYAISGVVFTLAFTRGDKPHLAFNVKPLTFFLTTLFILANYVYNIIMGIDRFSFLYAFSFGVIAGLIFSWKNQNTFTFYTEKKHNQIPKVAKTKPITYRGTLIIISISFIIFFINTILISHDTLIDIYGKASIDTWLKAFWNNLDSFDNISSWFLNMNTEKVNQGQFWRFFTNVFAHYGLEHILFNMPIIFFTGKYIEPKIGTFKWVSLFLCSSFIVTMSWYLTNAEMTTTNGSSLGLFAFMALYFLYAFEKDNQDKTPKYEMLYIFIYFILGNIPGVGVWGEGHLTSFMVGIIAIFLFRALANRNKKFISV